MAEPASEFPQVKDETPKLLATEWVFLGIAFVLVGFRVYVRLAVVHQYGLDDHFFNFAVFCLMVFVICITVAAHNGLGREMTDPGSEESKLAILLVNICQTITCVAIISIKTSIACFLLRIVGHNRAYKIAIILPVTVMSIALFIAAWLLWFSCDPVSYAWDITQPGNCSATQQLWSVGVGGVMIIIVELWYASFPWYIVRGLQMPKREMILIGTSMSVSYISAACSISRLFALIRLTEATYNDFLVYIVDVLVWHGADITTQLLCIGITVCRPLYKDWLNRVADKIEKTGKTSGSSKQDSTYGARKAADAAAMRTIGGSEVKRGPDGSAADKRSGNASRPTRKPEDNLRRNLVFQDDAGTSESTMPIPRLSQLEKTTSAGAQRNR